MDPLPIFLTASSVFVGTTILQYRIAVRLAKWLHLHHHEIWKELGGPGTTFFKGDEGNRYFTRTLAMSGLSRRMMQGDVKMLPRCEAVEAMLRRYRCLDRISTTTFVLIASYITWHAVTDQGPAKAMPSP